MKKVLLIVTADWVIKPALEVGIETFLFPFKGYAVGFQKYYQINEMKTTNSFLYLNKCLTNQDIDELKVILNRLPSYIKGVCFSDLGLIPVLAKTNLIRILVSFHLIANHDSFNCYSNLVEAVLISPEITNAEAKIILNSQSNQAVGYGFGRLPLLYSRRQLLTNWAHHYNLKKTTNLKIKERNQSEFFEVIENKWGTVLYSSKFYHNLEFGFQYFNYILVNPWGLNQTTFRLLLKNWARGNYHCSSLNGMLTNCFTNQETIYRLPSKQESKNE